MKSQIEETSIPYSEEHFKFAKNLFEDSNKSQKKEELRKDIGIIANLLYLHINNSIGGNFDYIIGDEIDRGILTKKLLNKVKQL